MSKSAEQQSLDRIVAIKTLHSEYVGRKQAEEAFLIEAEVLAELEHPNIVPIIDYGRNLEGAPYYVMKRVDGKPWSAFLSRTPINLDPQSSDGKTSPGEETVRLGKRTFTIHEHLEVLLKVCDAVAFAHSRGVIHRDLKPDNIMVGPFGEVLVLDWGLAVTSTKPRRASQSCNSDLRSQPRGHTCLYVPRNGMGRS